MNHDSVTLGGKGYDEPVYLGNVADGVNPYDAVNMRQLNGLRKEAYAGIAQAAAMVNMSPDVDGETTLNVGVASYGGQTAIGLSVARQVGRTILHGAVGAGAGNRNLLRVGAGWRF